MVTTKQVTIRPMGSRPKKVRVPTNATIKQILRKANISAGTGTKMIANGVNLTMNSRMGRHTEIILIPKVKGGK